MNKIFTIIKKELKRFFGDKRMLMNLIMPGIVIFIIYALMGTFMGDAMSADKDYNYKVYVTNYEKAYLDPILEASELKITLIKDETNIDDIKQQIINKEADLYISFEEGFKDKVDNGQKPSLSIYYNSSSNESSNIYTIVSTYLTQIGTKVDFDFLVNMDPNDNYNLATDEDMSAKVLTMMLPYLLLIFLFSGCLSTTSESIAGEKERGTMNTLLVTPTKRSHIAIGKIIALSITSLVSATSSFIGLIASMPFLLNAGENSLTLSMYGFGTYAALYFVILVTIIFFTTLLSIVSAYSKNVKEAGQYSSIVMMIVMVMGVSSMIGAGNIPTNPAIYLIPIYNSVQALSSLFAMEFNLVNFTIAIVSNLVYIGLGVYLLSKMFDSEKMMSCN